MTTTPMDESVTSEKPKSIDAAFETLQSFGDGEQSSIITGERRAEQTVAVAPSFVSRYLEEFQHIRLIGKGGFGHVFEAMHKLDQRRFAIKRIRLRNR